MSYNFKKMSHKNSKFIEDFQDVFRWLLADSKCRRDIIKIESDIKFEKYKFEQESIKRKIENTKWFW